MEVLQVEVQPLGACLAALEAQQRESRKHVHNALVPPLHTHKANLPAGPGTRTRHEASAGRAGGDNSLHPDPDHVLIAQAKTCPYWGDTVQQAHAQHPHAVCDKIELPPVKLLVRRVEPQRSSVPRTSQQT